MVFLPLFMGKLAIDALTTVFLLLFMGKLAFDYSATVRYKFVQRCLSPTLYISYPQEKEIIIS
ncbi:putative membrane protein [Paenibacillus riograndensis SBR5]|uniref:Putative membrane protein n=1 Tax=Paenibacillus riograndensis SBR5 TaxID=1073571 RepID=A0A0E4HFJ6_9BACL|nr:putative membrane protein [Paenibacillus riograndensis SBR5]